MMKHNGKFPLKFVFRTSGFRMMGLHRSVYGKCRKESRRKEGRVTWTE